MIAMRRTSRKQNAPSTGGLARAPLHLALGSIVFLGACGSPSGVNPFFNTDEAGGAQDLDGAGQDSATSPPLTTPSSDATTGVPPDAGGTVDPVDAQPGVDTGAQLVDSAPPPSDAPGPVDAPGVVAEGGGEGGIGVPACSASKYVICEDFESTAVGMIPTGWTGMGQVGVAADDAYLSKHSLKFSVAAGGAANYRSISTDASKLGASHWGRVYLRVETPVPSYFAHDTFVYLTGNGPTRGNEQVRVVDTVMQANHSHQFLYNVQPSGAEFGKGSDYRYTWDTAWHCAEWYLDNSKQSYHFYFDKVEVTQIAIDNGAGVYTNSDIPSAFTRLTLSVNQYQSPPAGYNQQPVWMTAWMDALAIDVNRIGCN